MKRRDFIKKSAAVGAVLGFPAIIPSVVLGQNGKVTPSNRVAIGLIACGNRSRYAGDYRHYAKSEVVAVCDPIEWRRMHQKAVFGNCADYIDFREMLTRKDIDAVHISTPDHWHIPAAMLAAKAGKDIYLEKPLSLCIDHDLKSRAIVDQYKRVFQYGAQQRSMTHVRLGIELVLNGHIGEVQEVCVWAPSGRSGRSATPIVPVPKEINDYDLWLGPAPEAPFCEDRVLYKKGLWFEEDSTIYHHYDYAIGLIAGWGAHPMDMLQWWADNVGMSEIPVKYEGTGTIPTKGLLNTVTHWDVHAAYANGLKLHFMDHETANRKRQFQGGHGTLFIGDKGWVVVSRDGWSVSSEEIRRKAKIGDKRLKVSRHQGYNFVDCVLSRETPVDDLHSAVRSDLVTHLSDIAIRTGKPVQWDPKKETIVGNAEGIKMMNRTVRAPWTV